MVVKFSWFFVAIIINNIIIIIHRNSTLLSIIQLQMIFCVQFVLLLLLLLFCYVDLLRWRWFFLCVCVCCWKSNLPNLFDKTNAPNVVYEQHIKAKNILTKKSTKIIYWISRIYLDQLDKHQLYCHCYCIHGHVQFSVFSKTFRLLPFLNPE